MSHTHGPSCGCSEEAKESALVESLFPAVDRDRITCYNEHEPGAGKRVVKPFSDRLTTASVQANDNDTELLLVLPFIAAVKLHSLALITTGHTAATTIRLFINRDDIDMSTVNDTAPTETIANVQEDSEGTVDYKVKRFKFNNVNTLILHIKNDSPDAAGLEVRYINLKGEKTADRRAIVNAVYEARALPEDHTARDEAEAGQNIFDVREAQ